MNKIKRTLYIGLGGTGLKALLYTKKCFYDAYGEIPPMVRFLLVDTDYASTNKTLKSRTGDEIRLTENELAFCGIANNALATYRENITDYGWMPSRNEYYLRGVSTNGAGQIRSNGKFLAQFNWIDIANKVERAVKQASAPLPDGSQFQVDTAIDGKPFPTYVNIVGSVAGGTGSGTFIDMLVLCSQALSATGFNFKIHPWLVLPDVYRHNFPGAASFNVYQNAYGALRELDYLYHLSGKATNPIDFGHASISTLPQGIEETTVINMTNKAGISFQTDQDLADSIGRCLFLDANAYTDSVGSVLDNLQHVQANYNIGNKAARFLSAGSAEMIYDNQAVGNVVAAAMISDICGNLTKSQDADTLGDANTWTMHPDVRIQEHDMDQLTDDMFERVPGYTLTIGKDTDENYIKAFIASATTDQKDILAKNRKDKFTKVKNHLTDKINSLLKTKGPGYALAFIDSLSDNIKRCNNEMVSELEKLNAQLQFPKDWKVILESLYKSVFGFKQFDNEAATILAQDIIENHIGSIRDKMRHEAAISFYGDLLNEIGKLRQSLTNLIDNLKTINNQQLNRIADIQQNAITPSEFQIFLYTDDVNNIPHDEQATNQLLNSHDISKWLGQSKDNIYNNLWNFVKERELVKDAVSTTIDDKLRTLDNNVIQKYIMRLKQMSSPMWLLDYQGQITHNPGIANMFAIGVEDNQNTVLAKYTNDFAGTTLPTFATTNQSDRITLFQVEAYAPLYAIVNLKGYEREFEEMSKKRNSGDNVPASYIDERWNTRIESEKFDINPKKKVDNILPNWINAILFGYIKYEPTKQEYYIKSIKLGNKRKGGYLALGNRRDIAFNAFRARGLEKEIEENINNMIRKNGQPVFDRVMKNVKDNLEKYTEEYAQLSPIEKQAVDEENSTYQMVFDLLDKEIDYIDNLQF